MSDMDCATVREWIPDVAAGRSGREERRSVDRHTTTCEECRAELALARVLFEGRESAPRDLSAPIVAALGGDRRVPRRPWWGISAAAIAALALGIGVSSRTPETPAPSEAEVALDTEEGGELWLADDGVLAGAPVFETLSDEALAELLEDMTPTPNGGQA